MATVTVARDVHAPQRIVFDVLTDLEHAADRIRGIEQIDLDTPGPMREGTKWTETRIMMGKPAIETMWVTEFAPPSHYVVEAESRGTHYRTLVKALPTGDDTSRIEYIFEGRPVSLMAKLMSPMFVLFKGMVAKCFQEDLDDIAAAAEEMFRQSKQTPAE
ncbi:MAG: SRPBCC family protein [Planctomycetota bacterium]